MKWSTLLSSDRMRSHRISENTTDLRSEFEKDYHRIIVSAPFRRLQDKTQVFPLDQSDFIRTRLTHSLEVSSVSRSLGQNISQYIIRNIKDPEFDLQMQSDMCSILQCAGLIHDIGNPPFGHFGETTIRDWFRTHLPRMTFEGKPLDKYLMPQMVADFYHFEGNAQALRLVTKLHFLEDDMGMNLTYALLNTIVKYPVSSVQMRPNSTNIKDKKPGYFFADKDIFEKIQAACDLKGCRHPLSFILEAADDISYLTADIEDAYKKGYFTYRQFLEELYSDSVLERLTGEERNAYIKIADKLEKIYHEGKRKNVADPEEYAISNWIVIVQGFLINCATTGFTQNYHSIMNGSYGKDLFAGTMGVVLHDVLGEIAFNIVFTSQSIYKTEIAAASVLDYLLNKFMAASLHYDTSYPMTDVQDKLMTLISDNCKALYHRQSQGKSPQEKLYLRILLVTDYICGMTDSYAKRLYQEMNGII